MKSVLTAVPLCPYCEVMLDKPSIDSWEGLNITRGDRLWCARTAPVKMECKRCRFEVEVQAYLSVDYVTRKLNEPKNAKASKR